MQKDGTTIPISLEVKYVPDLWTNLVSITAALKNGTNFSNDREAIVFRRKNLENLV
jgi:hypothetical protein